MRNNLFYKKHFTLSDGFAKRTLPKTRLSTRYEVKKTPFIDLQHKEWLKLKSVAKSPQSRQRKHTKQKFTLVVYSVQPDGTNKELTF